MRKTRLDLSELAVESFDLGEDPWFGEGTVRGHFDGGLGDPDAATTGQVRPGTCDSGEACANTKFSTACTGWCCQPSVEGVQPCGGETYTSSFYNCPP